MNNGDGTFTYTDELGTTTTFDTTGVGDNWGTDVVNIAGGILTGDGTSGNPLTLINVDDADADPTNEIELPTQSPGDAGLYLQADGAGNVVYTGVNVNDADSDPTNEIQSLSSSGNQINITGGSPALISSNSPTNSGEVLTWDGTNWTSQSLPSGSGWELTGNASTIPGVSAGENFVGTIDASDLLIATNSTPAMWISGFDQNVGIGISAPLTKFHVLTEGASNNIVSHAISNANQDDAGSIGLIRARGSLGSEANVVTGDRLGRISFNGFNSGTSNYAEGAYIAVVAEEDFISTGSGSRMVFHTAQMGGSTVEAMVIDATQSVGVGTTPFNGKFEVNNYDKERAGYFSNLSSGHTASYGVYAESFASSGVNANVGVRGEANGGSIQDVGVYGIANGIADAYGVNGEAAGTGANNYGIYGSATGATNNYAGYFDNGDVYIQNGLILPSGAGFGLVLTSDATGNASWQAISGGARINDLNNDTYIETDFLGDGSENIIRFGSGGTEYFTMNNGRIDVLNTNSSTFMGRNSGVVNTGANNTGYGFQTLQANTSGQQNTAIGGNALYANQTGSFNVAIGNQANQNGTATSGNVAVGYRTLLSNTASNIVAVGNAAMQNNTTGTQNTAIGYQALFANTDGSFNTALGYDAGRFMVSSFRMTAIGNEALRNNTGVDNTAVGAFALDANTTAGSNTAVGTFALTNVTTGGSNTAIGGGALQSTTGANNTAIGHSAGLNNTTGFTNLFVGYNADVGAGNLTNASAIGPNATVTQSNSMVLGDGTIDVGIGTSNPNERLHVENGNIAITDDNYRMMRIDEGADLLPVAYGVVLDGSIQPNASTSNFSVSQVGLGIYRVIYTGPRNFSGVGEFQVDVTGVYLANQVYVATYEASGSQQFFVRLYELNTGNPTDGNFSFTLKVK